MAQNQEVYRRVGRGGAGNYYSPKQQADAGKDFDLEAQDLSISVAAPQSSSSVQPGSLARGGRGGAGNFHDPSSLPDAREQSEMADRTAAAVNASLRQQNGQPRGGLGGRGGAGNWNSTGDEEERHRQQNLADKIAAKSEQVEREILEAVEKGLKVPEKVHHGRDKNEE